MANAHVAVLTAFDFGAKYGVLAGWVGSQKAGTNLFVTVS